MSFRFAALIGACSLALCTPFATTAAAAQEQAPEPLPLEVYGNLPEVESTALSASGNRIALLTTIRDRRVVLAMEGSKPLRAITVGDMKVRSLDWVGEDRIMITSSQTEDLGFGFTTDKAEFFVARVIPLADGEEGGIVFGDDRSLLDSTLGNYGMRTIDGRHYGYFGAIELTRSSGGSSRMGRYVFNHGRPFLYRVDLETMESSRVANAAPENEGRDWLIDANGEVAFRLDINYESGSWDIRNAQGTQIATGRNAMAAISLIGLGYDGTTAIYASRGPERTTWLEIDASGGEPRPFLPGQGFDGLFFDPETGHLMGYVVGEDENKRYVFADKTLEAKAEQVRKAFATLQPSINAFTSDLSNVIVRTSGGGDSGTYFAVNLGEGKAEAIAYERTAIEPQYVGPISTFEYTASDGMEMDGILTLPPGREAKNLPLVMLPHGGPHSYDSPTFDWWAQAFASRGYAVFQPNFRGSTNRTQAFTRAGYGEWGRKMQSDKTDGLNALAEAGIIDPSRACIVGASYGGYAALAGVTIEQGIYRCAVAVAPVSDIEDMYQQDTQASGRRRTTRTALLEQLGDRNTWKAVSPLKLADRADAPILLIHGKDDTVVPYSHSTQMADALKDAGKPYELVTLEGEDHWLSLSETRQRMLSEAVAFVQEHNPAD